MSQNHMKKSAPNTITYVGMDIAKATLQVHLLGHQIEFRNDSKDHSQLSERLARLSRPQVICEATGGYERQVVRSLQNAKIPVSVLNPAHTLAAIQAQGKRAKTDCCDAAALTDYGQRFQPDPTPPVQADQREVSQLASWLKQLIDNRAVAKTQAEHHEHVFVRNQHNQLVAHYNEQIQATEKKIKELVQAMPPFQQRLDCLMKIKGVGFRTALTTLVFMPELGNLNRGQAGALAGLAPWTRESGQMKGKSCIGGGRSQVRTALYMSALSSIRYNPVLKGFYEGLVGRNKPKKVALTAVMRRLLIFINHELKALNAMPQTNGAEVAKTRSRSKKDLAK
jgi:transposase